MNQEPKNETDEWENFVSYAGRHRLFIVAVVFTVLVISFVTPFILAKRMGGDTAAQLGETYIICHSLFDMLACVFVALTLLHEVVKVKGEREARRMESVFFPYMALFQSYMEHLECGSLRGRRIFVEWKALFEQNQTERLYHDYGVTLDYYFRHLEVILLFINKSKLRSKERESYLSLLQAQMSNEELWVFEKYRNEPRGRYVDMLANSLKFPKHSTLREQGKIISNV
jgi:hypothetical protein